LRARLAYCAGTLEYRLRDTCSSEKWHREALEIFRELQDRRGVAASLNALSMNARRDKRFEEARAMLEEAALLWREAGDDASADNALSNLGVIAQDQGDYQGACAIFEQLALRFRAGGNLGGVASAMSCLGDVAAAQQDHVLARTHYQQSLGLFRQLNDRAGAARVLADLGNLMRDCSEYETARLLYLESLQESVAVGRRSSIARALTALAECAVCQGRYARGLKLAGAAAAVWQTVGTEGEPAEQHAIQKILETTASQLAGAEHSQAWTGRSGYEHGRGGYVRFQRNRLGVFQRVDHSPDRRDAIGRHSQPLGMFLYCGFIRSHIDAVDFIVGDVTVKPADLRTQVAQNLQRF
jgi:tetratricopeptide (TPR) repeat protein